MECCTHCFASPYDPPHLPLHTCDTCGKPVCDECVQVFQGHCSEGCMKCFNCDRRLANCQCCPQCHMEGLPDCRRNGDACV